MIYIQDFPTDNILYDTLSYISSTLLISDADSLSNSVRINGYRRISIDTGIERSGIELVASSTYSTDNPLVHIGYFVDEYFMSCNGTYTLLEIDLDGSFDVSPNAEYIRIEIIDSDVICMVYDYRDVLIHESTVERINFKESTNLRIILIAILKSGKIEINV